MKMRMRVAAVIFAGAGIIAAAGEGAALASSAGAGTGAQPAGARAPRYVVVDCGPRPLIRPSTYTIACADAGIGVRHLHWTSWTPKLASAYGTFWENDCKPSCAQGHIYYYASREVLWGSASVKGHPGDRRYTRLTVIFTGKRPPVYVRRGGKIVATYPLTQTFRTY